MSKPAALLELESVFITYGPRKNPFTAVSDVSLDVKAGETVGLVGESGSGKTTVGRAILGLTPVSDGSIRFDGEDITNPGAARRRELTRDIQVIFQDPYGSLNPARTVGSTLAEPFLLRHRRLSRDKTRDKVHEALELVGMPASAAGRYPAEFSGGQRQRIAIARAVILRPRFIVCDEAVSALDLSIQAQVLNLLSDLSTQLGMGYLFISHDLAVVAHISSRIAVLYRGSLVEFGDADQVSTSPHHPYTAMLQAAAPIPNPADQRARRLLFQERSRQFRMETAPMNPPV